MIRNLDIVFACNVSELNQIIVMEWIFSHF